MRPALLFSTIAYALWSPMPAPLKLYMWSQLVYTVIMEGSIVLGVSISSTLYLVLFVLATMLVLIGGFLATMYYTMLLRNSTYFGTAGIVASIGLMAGVPCGVHHALGPYDIVSIFTGALLVGMAVTLGMTAPFLFSVDRAHARTAVSLSVTWYGLGLWSLTWPMVWDTVIWQRLNFVVPTMLIVASLSYVGYTFRHAPRPAA